MDSKVFMVGLLKTRSKLWTLRDAPGDLQMNWNYPVVQY